MSTRRRSFLPHFVRLTAAAAGLFLPACLLFCANQGRPAGGPIDEDPPRVAHSSPEAGAVMVSRRIRLSFTFSEWIDPRSAGQSVTVFPPIDKGFKVVVTGRRLDIVPGGVLADSTTYHVEISNSLQDLHANSIASPFHFVFATGPTLDSGEVSGCVVRGRGVTKQPKVALFRRDTADRSDTVLLSLPSYLVQTDTTGGFTLGNIRPGTYDIVSFFDEDNNNRLGSGREQAFTAIQKRFEIKRRAGPFTLFAVQCDSSTGKIASLKALNPALVLGQWTEATRSDTVLYTGEWTVIPVDTTEPPVNIVSYTSVSRSLRFVLRFNRDLSGKATYNLVYRPQRQISSEADTAGGLDTVRFSATADPDTTPPAVVAVFPRGITNLHPHIGIAWSEPVQPLIAACMLADTLGDTIVLGMDSVFADTVYCVLPHGLAPATAYTLRIPDTVFVDLSGNALRDTTDTAGIILRFTTASMQDLCLSISGTATCLEPDPLRIWRFLPFNSKIVYTSPDRDGAFRFDTIPSGKGSLAWFSDMDGDGMPTQGRLFPWKPPEPYLIFPDTIEARARWDIEGLTLKRCAPCPAPPRAADTTGTARGEIDTTTPQRRDAATH